MHDVVSQVVPADVEYVRGILTALGPPLERVTDEHITEWLARYGDRVWIASCFADRYAYIAGRGPDYLENILAERHGTDFKASADHVAYVLRSVEKTRGAA